MTGRERSHLFLSLLGDATCEECGSTWPCHLAAWGSPAVWSRCAVCRTGRVFWHAPDDRGDT